MSLDVKYRPQKYADVLGQDTTIEVLKGFVKAGAGYHQSYLFGGAFGSGKTTLARILARALLCDSPVDGEPCDECHSCRVLLENPDAHECYIEVDAAVNSGKASISKLVEDVQYNSFSGKQRIALLDESHELSRQALDALLLPMEDTQKGSQNKKMVCIFCTTEPEKMRPAVLSRCAPSFMIRPCKADVISERLSEICIAEGIEFEKEALPLIAEVKELHIRDCLKAVEGVSRLGSVSVENVRRYLNIDVEESYLGILKGLGVDMSQVNASLETLLNRVSPVTVYKKLAERATLAYKVAVLGSNQVPSYLDAEALKEVGLRLKGHLLGLASVCASRPVRATAPMILCDLTASHCQVQGVGLIPQPDLQGQVVQAAISAPAVVPVSSTSQARQAQPLTEPSKVEVPKAPSAESRKAEDENPGMVVRKPYTTSDGIYLDERAVRKTATGPQKSTGMSVDKFLSRLSERMEESVEDGGLSGRYDLGSS